MEPLHNRGYSIFNQQAGQIKLFGSEQEGFTPNTHSSKWWLAWLAMKIWHVNFDVAVKTWVISSQKKGFLGSPPFLGLHTPADAMEGLSSRHQRHPRGFAEDHQPGATRRTAAEKVGNWGFWGKPSPILERLFYLMTPRGWFQTIGSMGTYWDPRFSVRAFFGDQESYMTGVPVWKTNLAGKAENLQK